MILICILLHIYNDMYKNDIICWYLGENHVYKTHQFWGTKIAITPPNIYIF